MSQLPTTGAYALLISIKKPISVCIGKLGNVDFKEGWYIYVGSAMGRKATSLKYRVRRHLAPVTQKRMHWHVDYLLASPDCKVAGAVMVPSLDKIECQIVSVIGLMGGQPWGSRFGASDCSNCASHLHFLYPLEIDFSQHQILIRVQKEIQKSGLAAEILLK